MRRTHLSFSLKGQGVGGAAVKIHGIFPPVLFALAPVVIHFGSTVSTKHKAGQGIGDAGGICPAHRPLHLLGELPGFRVNNGLVGVLKDQPVGRIIFYPLIPIGLFGGTEIDGVPHILRLGQHGADRKTVPVIGSAGVHGVFPAAPAVAGQIIGGALHLFLCEYLGDLMGAVPLHRKPEDPPHHSGGFLVHQPVVLILRVFFVAIDGVVGGGLACLPLNTVCCRNLFGLVTQIPFVHDIEKGSKLAAVLFLAVNVIGDSYKMNPILPEHYLGVKAGLQVISADPT